MHPKTVHQSTLISTAPAMPLRFVSMGTEPHSSASRSQPVVSIGQAGALTWHDGATPDAVHRYQFSSLQEHLPSVFRYVV
jgi:hypothetical protein